MRLLYIDRIRAIAILAMIQVHTAAIVPPEGITVGDPIALVSAAIGGMAAPLFVTISGWGIYRSAISRNTKSNDDFRAWAKWILPRIIMLIFCQFLVNFLLSTDRGGRFESFTPGVLTLLAIATIIAPIIIHFSHQTRIVLLIVLAGSQYFIGDLAGNDWTWFERVAQDSFTEWIERLLWNGTYPALPWLAYIMLGSIIFELEGEPSTRDKMMYGGLVITTATLIYSFTSNQMWALPEGDAVLTFFPASTTFIFVSGTFVLMTFRILEGGEIQGGPPTSGQKLAILEPAGRLSLTIYVAHFAVLGIVADMMYGQARLDVIPAFAVTLIHTAIWIPLSILHERFISDYSLEKLLQKLNS